MFDFDEPECPHTPGLKDQVIYHMHTVWGHQPEIWGEGKDPQFVTTMCLTADWIEYGTACPPCIREYDKANHIPVHYTDEDF